MKMREAELALATSINQSANPRRQDEDKDFNFHMAFLSQLPLKSIELIGPLEVTRIVTR